MTETNPPSSSSSSDVPKAFPLAFGASVGFLSLIAIFICLCCLFLRRRRPRPITTTYSDDDDDSDSDDVAIDIDGVDAAAVKLSRFPKLIYSSSKSKTTNSTSAGGASVGSTSNCAICLADYSDGDLLRLLPDCGHSFHAICVDPWLMKQKSTTCPICRRHTSTPVVQTLPAKEG
ncbi:Putative RING-H2 finger protein ATL71 [Linum perenne]